MNFLLPFVCFLGIFRNSLGHHWIDRDSYQDILDINDPCYPLFSCYEPREYDPVDNFKSIYMCSCNSQCWEIGTCCIDSQYRGYPTNHECLNMGDTNGVTGYYAINGCPYDTHSDSMWKDLCETEWNGEDDILMLSPVTSLATSKTYKNYYCFKCHEATDEYISWNIFLESNYNVSEKASDYRVVYDRFGETWMVILDNRISIPVSLKFQFPDGMEQTPISCDLRMISDCADDWNDARIREKCLAYTAVVYNSYTKYKNVHCVLCNYQTLDSLTCKEPGIVGFRPIAAPALAGKFPLNFQHLLNVNEDSFDKVGSSGKCKKDHMWDPYGKKCRKLSCALPRYVIKDDRCVPPYFLDSETA